MTPRRKTPRRKTLRAGIYARQSHGKQRSIDEQAAECTRDAEAEGYEIVATYEDTVSASRHSRKARPDHARLLSDLEAGKLNVVVVWETSRADRRLTQWSELLDWCRDNGVLIRVTDDAETYDVRKPKHWKQLATDGISNAYASEETRQRNLRTARLTAEAGRPNGPCPYGYVRRYDPTTREMVAQEPVTDQAAIVVEIFTHVANGGAIKTLADDLAARGVPPPGQWRPSRRHSWTPQAIRAIAKNRAYVGRRAHNGDPDDHRAIWKPIVDEAQFSRAQRVLNERADRYWRATRSRHVLSGLPGCLGCEVGVFSGANSAKLGKTYYQCRKCGRGIDGAGLEELVLAYVLGRLAKPDVYGQLRRAGEDADAEVLAARAEADRLRARLDDWRDAAVRGEVTPPTMSKIETDLTRQIDTADRRAERAGIPPAVRELVGAGDQLPERWAAMPIPARRDVIAALVDVTIKPGRRGGRMPVEERVTVTWKADS